MTFSRVFVVLGESRYNIHDDHNTRERERESDHILEFFFWIISDVLKAKRLMSL